VTSEIHQRRVARVLVVGLGTMLAALAGYLLYIQVYSAEALASVASRQQRMRIPLYPQRGSILDARLRPLARSVEAPSLFADPKLVLDPEETANRIAAILDVPADAFYDKILEEQAKDPPGRFVWLARRITPEAAEAIRHLGLPGIGFVSEGIRSYPNNSLAAHVLGYVGADGQGLDALEMLFNQRLAGRKGEAFVMVDRGRRPIWTDPEHFTPSEDGQHLVLTIDATLQATAEEALAESVQKYQAVSGSAIVMDPTTGAILAMANVPTFDPNHYDQAPASARVNRAVTDPFPPGSSCKPFFAGLAVQWGAARFSDVTFCENGYWAAAKMHDAGHSYGNLTLAMILIKSSNIGMAKLGTKLGNERLHNVLDAFGFGRKTGVWLPGESSGLVWSLRRWNSMSTTRIPIGQEFMATPLQMAMAFSAIANKGVLMRPQIVRGVLDTQDRAALDPVEPEVLGQAMDPKVARQLIDQALVGVVEEGTGTNCKIPGFKIFGKTGTASKIDPDTKRTSDTRYVGAFLCGVPAKDPKLVVVVMINEPKKSLGYYGGTVAAPVAKKILEQALPYLGITPSEPVAGPKDTHLVRHDVRVTD
jgi:cell division protein FtsI (penicillin-binding protein 3)